MTGYNIKILLQIAVVPLGVLTSSCYPFDYKNEPRKISCENPEKRVSDIVEFLSGYGKENFKIEIELIYKDEYGYTFIGKKDLYGNHILTFNKKSCVLTTYSRGFIE